MSRHDRIEKTLHISSDKLAFTRKPLLSNNLLNKIVKEVILPGRVQKNCRLKFCLMPILRKSNQIVQYPYGRIPARKAYL